MKAQSEASSDWQTPSVWIEVSYTVMFLITQWGIAKGSYMEPFVGFNAGRHSFPIETGIIIHEG